MTTDDLRTRAREAAEEAYRKPRWHIGTITDRLIEAFYEGFLAHATQQPSRDIDVDELARVIALHEPGPAGRCQGCPYRHDWSSGAFWISAFDQHVARAVRDYLTGDD